MSFIPLLMCLPGNRHRTGKGRIRQLAAGPVADSDIIFIDCGTTLPLYALIR